jgi:hypothetical protein
LRTGPEHPTQNILSGLKLPNSGIPRLDVLAHKEDLLFRPYKLLEDPCHDQTIGAVRGHETWQEINNMKPYLQGFKKGEDEKRYHEMNLTMRVMMS